jgi:hypothetical protein
MHARAQTDGLTWCGGGVCVVLRHLDGYAAEYKVIKARRRLQWLPSLGRVDVVLDLADRTVARSVSPMLAATISLFEAGGTVPHITQRERDL